MNQPDGISSMTAQVMLIACLLLLVTAMIVLALCVLNWRIYVALYQGNLPDVWCCGIESSTEERTAVVDRNPSRSQNNLLTSRGGSTHLEQIEKLKKWHLNQLSTTQTAGCVLSLMSKLFKPIITLTVHKEELPPLPAITQASNIKELNKIYPSASVTSNQCYLNNNNNVYEDINTNEFMEMNHLKSSDIKIDIQMEHDPTRMHYTSISEDYLDQSLICSVRKNIPVASSPVICPTRNHLAQIKKSWKLSPDLHHQSYEGFESTGVSCIYFNPEPDYEDSGLPETFLAKDTLEKKIKQIP